MFLLILSLGVIGVTGRERVCVCVFLWEWEFIDNQRETLILSLSVIGVTGREREKERVSRGVGVY
jgi:hypothetical protein